jgi:aspartate 1-decarboxylase
MKVRVICKSKIDRAVVTPADVNCIGSIGIGQTLLDLTDIVAGEQVAVWNLNNDERIETYAIAMPGGSGAIAVNGAAAHHFRPGDLAIIAAFSVTDELVEPRMIAVDERNRLMRHLTDNEPQLS